MRYLKTVSNTKSPILFCFLVILLVCGCNGGGVDRTDQSVFYLNGAGASFPNPLYQSWFFSLAKQEPGVRVNYQSIGSGAGIEQFRSANLDFGASDVVLTETEASSFKRRVLQVPLTAGAIVLAYNVPEISGSDNASKGSLKISRENLGAIFSGQIVKWNDERLIKDNHAINLPDRQIMVVHRSDGSGTTAAFTKVLAGMSSFFSNQVGVGKSVKWPDTGNFIGARGNEGVVEQLRQSPYSIGYVEYGYAIQSGLPKAQVENRSGKFVAPDLQRTSQALEELVSDGDVFPEIADQTGDLSYPFLCFSWLLVEESYTDSKKAEGIERMVEFGLNEGQAVSESLGFIPLPYAIKKRALEMIDSIDSTYKMRLSANGL